MRIISGTLKGRMILPPKNLPVRPTTDFAKEALFNILRMRLDFDAIRVLDLFAGTGSISYEFLSRGSQHVLAIEQNPICYKFIRESFTKFGFSAGQVIRADVHVWIKQSREKFDMIFADPPYEMPSLAMLPQTILNAGLLTNDGLLIVEHGDGNDFSTVIGFTEMRRYGHVHFSFFTASRNPLSSTD